MPCAPYCVLCLYVTGHLPYRGSVNSVPTVLLHRKALHSALHLLWCPALACAYLYTTNMAALLLTLGFVLPVGRGDGECVWSEFLCCSWMEMARCWHCWALMGGARSAFSACGPALGGSPWYQSCWTLGGWGIWLPTLSVICCSSISQGSGNLVVVSGLWVPGLESWSLDWVQLVKVRAAGITGSVGLATISHLHVQGLETGVQACETFRKGGDGARAGLPLPAVGGERPGYGWVGTEGQRRIGLPGRGMVK